MGAADEDSEVTGRRAGDGGRSDRASGVERLSFDAYLRSSHGFLVDTTRGRELGIVDDVVTDPRTGRVLQIEVCGGWFGRRRTTIDARSVRGVYPEARRLVVASAVVDEAQR